MSQKLLCTFYRGMCQKVRNRYTYYHTMKKLRSEMENKQTSILYCVGHWWFESWIELSRPRGVLWSTNMKRLVH